MVGSGPTMTRTEVRGEGEAWMVGSSPTMTGRGGVDGRVERDHDGLIVD
jgi:hypothetical protein